MKTEAWQRHNTTDQQTTALRRIKELTQEAFRGRYTSRQLCALIILDVENAFNSAPRNEVLNELQKRGISPYLFNMIDSYFDERTLMVGEARILEGSCRIPQESMLGPTLWNIYYTKNTYKHRLRYIS
ncbi:hypothetical protein Trydic_g19217 [Trypoxylus dichotomus]